MRYVTSIAALLAVATLASCAVKNDPAPPDPPDRSSTTAPAPATAELSGTFTITRSNVRPITTTEITVSSTEGRTSLEAALIEADGSRTAIRFPPTDGQLAELADALADAGEANRALGPSPDCPMVVGGPGVEVDMTLGTESVRYTAPPPTGACTALSTATTRLEQVFRTIVPSAFPY